MIRGPAALREQRVPAAFLRGTEAELEKAFAGWTPRRRVPIRVALENPFTGLTELLDSYEPEVTASLPASALPLAPPLPFTPAPLNDVCNVAWADELLLLHAALVGEDLEAIEAASEGVVGWDLMEQLFPRALYGATHLEIRAVPAATARGAARLTDDACAKLADTLLRDVPGGTWPTRARPAFVGALRGLRDLARVAEERSQALWFWIADEE